MPPLYNDKVILHWCEEMVLFLAFPPKWFDSTVAQQPWSWHTLLFLLHCGWLPTWGLKPQVCPLCRRVHRMFYCCQGKAMHSTIYPSCSCFVEGDSGQKKRLDIHQVSLTLFTVKGCNNTWSAFRVSSPVSEWGQIRIVKGIRFCILITSCLNYILYSTKWTISLFKGLRTCSCGVYMWMEANSQSVSLFMNNMISRIHRFILNSNSFFSSSQMLMTASPSRVKMEALASTRSTRSSAFACPATEETPARKVRTRIPHQKIQHIVMQPQLWTC